MPSLWPLVGDGQELRHNELWHTLKSLKSFLQYVESMQVFSPLKCDGIVLHNLNPYFNECLYH